MLECPACLQEFQKLKQLPNCGHGFCAECLEKLVKETGITCAFCRTENVLPPFGIRDLAVQFSGEVECDSCHQQEELTKCSWCKECAEILCKNCSRDEKHNGHSMDLKGHYGLVQYCTRQIEKYSELHTNLYQINKSFVSEYMQRAEEAVLKILDKDLQQRIERFKQEKQMLETVFEVPYKDDGTDSEEVKLDGAKFVAHMSQLQLIGSLTEARKPSDLLQRDGPVFDPPNLDDLVASMLKEGRITTAGSARSNMPKKDSLRPVLTYLGSGIVTHPCDLTVVSSASQILVSTSNSGLYCLALTDGSLVNRVIPSEHQQFVCADYCTTTGHLYMASLDDYRNWNIRIYDDIKCSNEISSTECPNEPKIAVSWYRWLTVLSPKFFLVSAGDKNRSALWLHNSETKEWTLISEEEGSTYRRASFKSLGRNDIMIYVPDMQRMKIKTLTMKAETGELTGFSEITYAELKSSIPVALDVEHSLLVVGYWLTGDIVLADLLKGSSKAIACVGKRELLSLRLVGGKVYALCKNKEMVQVYNIAGCI